MSRAPPHLELIMTDGPSLTVHEARALLSEHIEDNLDAATRAAVDHWLAHDPGLAVERDRLAATLGLLRELRDPDPPGDLASRVRQRITGEMRVAALEPADGTPASPRSVPTHIGRDPKPARSRWGVLQVSFAAAAAVAALVILAHVRSDQTGAVAGTSAAGLGGAEASANATWTASHLAQDIVGELAAQAGMESVGGNVFEGDRRATARFFMALKQAAVVQGGDVHGPLPDGERARIHVRAE